MYKVCVSWVVCEYNHGPRAVLRVTALYDSRLSQSRGEEESVPLEEQGRYTYGANGWPSSRAFDYLYCGGQGL
jgi:hypothetical protein